jgi:hypothetical protein
MYTYCRDVLLLSEHEAYNRIEAARAAQRFPIILELLVQGAVSLTAVRLLAPHLTPANHGTVLESARGLSRPQVEQLRLAKDLLRHANPAGDDAAILKRALTALLADLVKKKFAASDRPRVSGGSNSPGGSRYIRAEVARAVFLRDFGRCAYVGKDGHRCNERAFVEFHHVHRYCEGGPPTVENIELRCRRHNQDEWRQRSHGVRVLEEEWYRRRAESERGQRKGGRREGLVPKRAHGALRAGRNETGAQLR